MTNIVGIRFQQDGKMFSCDAGMLTPAVGDYVIVETSHGNDLGEVILEGREMADDQLKGKAPRVIRIATAQDIQRATDNRTREKEAFQVCHQKILEHHLEMKLVSAEVLFDNSKMLFYFTANGRVDFRALVKDLASIFKTRIELRQIGVRDEARMLGGLGPCGRPICCGAFLNDFQPVSIKMAKEQNLSLNPTKISGVCGRLMCCLKYEQDQYDQIRKRMPRIGKEVITPDGTGTVSDLNIVKETVSVRIPNGDSTEVKEYPLAQISRPGANPAPQENDRTEETEKTVEQTNRPDPENLRTDDTILTEEETIQLVGTDIEALIEEEDNAEKSRPKRRRPSRNPNRFGPRPQQQEKTEEGENKARKQKTGRPVKTDKQNRPAREQQFGQPVKRENPSRTKNAQPVSGVSNIAPEKNAQTPEKKKTKNWAAAVEKALQASDT
ncbi:MAG: stage 0 sporulation family protein [Clostridia bacterium]|nr:stage 0 sporulation family protein [Clostridia bacterium]